MVERYTKQIEKLYDCECTIETEIDQMDEETGIMAKSTKIDGPYPCRLSYKTSNIANMAEIPKFTQYTSLFCSPSVIIPKGSRIAVTGRNTKQFFRSASISSRYDTHQEVQLENLEVH
jgi:hypothetical protein